MLNSLETPTAERAPSPGARLQSIDGLRGLACLMVLLYHSCDHFGKAAWPAFRWGPFHVSQAHVFAYGYGGVDLFFVLSGFCLAYPIVSRPARRVNWKQYFVHRARRILPPYWAALLLFGLASLALRQHPVSPLTAQHVLDWPGARQVAYSALLISTAFNSSFWTLPVEWRWYFTLPFLMWLWRRIGAGGALLCTLPICLLSLDVIQPSHQERLKFLLTNLPTFLPLFGLGLWAAALAGQPNRAYYERQIVRLAPWGAVITALIVLADAPLWMSAFTGPNALRRLATWGPLCFFLTLAATQEGRFQRGLSWRPLVTLGLFSYSLYLIHEPFLRAAGALILPERWPAPIQFLMQTIILPTALIGLAYMFYLLFEKPFLRQPVRAAAPAEPAQAKSAPPARTISVVILTYNEAHRLRPCLESAAWADEIVVVDGGSTDGTVALAQEFTPHVFVSRLLGPDKPGGFSDQRNFALEQSTSDWIFFVDADERITPELAAEIQARLLGETDERHAGYQVRRREHFFGVYSPHTHGESWLTRLVRRGQGRWDGRLVHEGLAVDGAVGDLNGALLHFSKDTVAQYVATMNRYTSLEAEELAKNGAPGARSPWSRMGHAFLYRYCYMGSYREGMFGLLMSLMFAFYQYLCWAKHWEICKNAGLVPGESKPARRTALVSGALGGLWHGWGRARERLRGAKS